MDTENILRYVRLELGEDRGHGITVEASEAQIVQAIRSSLELYSRYRPIHSYQKFSAQPGGMAYTPDPAIREILDLSMIPKSEGEIFFPETGLFGGSFLNYGGSFDFTIPRQYLNYLQWKKVSEEVLSQEPGWFFDSQENTLYIFNPGVTVQVSLTGAVDFDFSFEEEVYEPKPVDPDDVLPSTSEFGALDSALALVPTRHMIWVRGLAVAKTKQTIGHMRRKYGIVPSTEGKDVQLDGQQMIEEGKSMWEEIKEEMSASAPGYEPIIE